MIRHLISKIDKDDSIWGEDITKNSLLCQTCPGLSWLYALGNHMGLDIFHFLKVKLRFSNRANFGTCILRFADFLFSDANQFFV